MDRVEYKLEQVHWQDEDESRLDQLVERLNELAKDGWRAVSVDLTAHPSFEVKSLPVLLVREVELKGEVEQRAYERYEERGRGEGRAAQDWNAAENEVFAK